MKKLIKVCLSIVGLILIAVLGLLIYLRMTEYRPEEKERVAVEGTSTKKLNQDDVISILTYNIGYGALSQTEDFFMDGGKTIQPDSKKIVQENLKGIGDQLKEQDADVYFLQEADRDSKRSYYVDEVQELWEGVEGTQAFAPNFSCRFVPYPLPPIGKVYGGITTLNRYDVINAERIAFPSSFRWPVSMCNLKRCLLVERTPVEGMEKEVVFINLHLEAYDSGEGKMRQSKILADVMKSEYEKGNYVIAGGDFNQSFSCVDSAKYPVKNTDYFTAGEFPEEYFGDGWQIVMDDEVPTSRLLNEPYDKNSNDTQYYMLDGYIVSPNIKIIDLETQDYDFQYTDHNPVKIKIKLK
ncbi:MAG: endonuclease [Lachnospiraceae bacterium]|nr:endonuclease [Lachnospiraceae bacterium]